MGVLDDAIREHLELKRRHGASDEEIAQAESEALGPARREPASELLGGDDDLLDAEAGPETELMEAPPLDPDDGEPLHPDVETIQPQAPPLSAVEPEPLPEEPAMGDIDAPTEIHPLPAEPYGDPLLSPDSPVSVSPDEAAAVEPPEPSTRPHGDPATAGDALEPDEVPADEQLTARAPLPPHDDAHDAPAPVLPPDDAGEPPSGEQRGEDRLWFEQKPHRDFDFDE